MIKAFLIVCAFAVANAGVRVSNGRPATEAEASGYVSLRLADYDATFGEGQFCNGALVSSTAVVTAAHCVLGKDPADLSVVMGTLSLYTQGGDTIVRGVSNILVHPDFEYYISLANDVAIITLDSAVPSHPWVAPVSVATATPSAGTTCVLTGFGATTYNGQNSATLMSADADIISFSSCDATFGGILEAGQMCAGNSACTGDIGAPLVCSGSLVGLVSYEYECGESGYPSIYTEVSAFASWISSNI